MPGATSAKRRGPTPKPKPVCRRCAGPISRKSSSGHCRDCHEELFSEANDPTPEEIAAACREIQAEWGNRTRRTRAAWAHPPHWTVPGARSMVEASDA